MDPKCVKLTTLQKIKPLLKAINTEVPWEFVLLVALASWAAIYSTAAIPVLFSVPFWDFIIRRLLIGFSIGVLCFFMLGFCWMLTVESLIPLIRKIMANYEEESLKVKKEVLDNVIDDEILKK